MPSLGGDTHRIAALVHDMPGTPRHLHSSRTPVGIPAASLAINSTVASVPSPDPPTSNTVPPTVGPRRGRTLKMTGGATRTW